MDCTTCTPRKPWELPFLAEPEGVAALRRVLRVHLGVWGLPELTDAAQLCVSELVSNVITHVGPGTPSVLAVSMNGTYLRIEVHDPDTRTLPTLVSATADAEGGRGMALVDAVADRWGVEILADNKVTWCELATGLTTPYGHRNDPHVSRAEMVVDLYKVRESAPSTGSRRVSNALIETIVVGAIADLLHWLRAHGRDVDEALDRAQTHFEVEERYRAVGAR
ncbi:ATP-binding protein [Streptomyces sp. NPDC001843]|uniref:ATP-binding protein n=1 Tax=Streptomyces sp. NPDC001843 TaxID=3364617 RepID=UPI00368840E6